MNMTIARTDNSLLGHWWWSVDKLMLSALGLLILAGVILIAASSTAIAERLHEPSFYFVLKHLFYLVPTFGLIFGISLMSPKTIRRTASIIFLVSLAMLALVPVVGSEHNGAQRWISLGGFSVQPSEFIKPSFAVVAAWLFSSQHRDHGFPGYLISCGLCALIVGLLLLQPDLGMTVVVSLVWAAQFFVAGLPLSVVAILFVLGVTGLFGIYMTFPHVTSRIDRFLDPQKGDTYQVDRSLEAFQHGGFFGTGPGQGEIKRVLPDAHADFIFAVSGEEFGLVLTIGLVFLYGFIIWRGMQRIRNCENLFVMLAVSGLLVQFGGQALIHMGSSLRLLPAKGMTLPLISYGGSSQIAICVTAGFILALTRHRPEKRAQERSFFRSPA
ncbi:MAG: ftsW, partial [Alphaproteobacteria bacterium]|nr:ftsW [Alphaproteobacteria bacterium]